MGSGEEELDEGSYFTIFKKLKKNAFRKVPKA